MKNLVLSFVLSFLLHGLVAGALVACLEYAPQPDVLATLDLSSVELSFAEEENASAAAVAPVLPSPTRESPVPRSEKSPEAKFAKPLPPDPVAPRLREPKEEPRQMEPLRQVSQPAPRQARVDALPRPKRNIRPDYPKGARQRGEQGDVTLELHVDVEGAVAAVTVVASSGFAELDEAAVKAAKAAKFKPARSGRDPVASVARLKLSFKLK